LAGKIAELELENRKMKQELEEYHTETAYLKNQQATVRRLEERNRLLEQQVSALCFPWPNPNFEIFNA
jgi:homeobox protein cut-like